MEKSQQEQQEILFKLNILEQHINQLQQQLEAVKQGMVELSTLSLDINELIGSEGTETLSPVGKGIFAKTKLISEDLIMDIGGKNFVKKSVPETQEIIKEQIKKLKEVEKELNENLKLVHKEVENVIESVKKDNEV